MKHKEFSLKAYKVALITASFFLIMFILLKHFSSSAAHWDKNLWITFGIFLLISIPANKMVLKIPHIGEIRLSDILYYASFILLSPFFLVMLILFSVLFNYFLKIKATVKKNIFFIAANNIMTYLPACMVYDYIRTNSDNNFIFMQKNLPAFLLASFICYALKNGLDNLNKIFSKKIPGYYFWNFHSNKTLINIFVISPLGFFTGLLAKSNMAVFLLFMVPVILTFKTLQDYTTLLCEIREALKTISFLIDKKEESFAFHSYSVANLSKKIAHNMRLGEKETDRIYNAALIHDLGKIAISDQLLRKETALTVEEYERIKKHPLVGSDLISRLNTLADESIIVKHHHEHYDGSGYPEGLDRDKIPLGSRVLAVSEAYNTMISSQPYKKKMSKKDALEEIKMSRGFQFDPRIVEALTKVLKNEN